MRWILIITLLISGTIVSTEAMEGTFKRDERRKLIPLNKLKRNLEDSKKIQLKQPEKVLDELKIGKGEIIADIGAGTGVYSFRLADRVGIEGKVYAVEIEDELLDYIRNKMAKNKITNIIPIKSSDFGPNLPPACCDKIIVTNSYYYFTDTVIFMENIRKSLKPGGLVAIIDLDAAKVPKVLKNLDKLRLASEIIEEMKSIGLVLHESHDFLKNRFFLVFKAKE